MAKKKVFIQGPGAVAYIQMFLKHGGFFGARHIEEADLVCFTGGEDVDPSLYGQKPGPMTHYNPKRDTYDRQAFDLARENDIMMVGICRGGQLLNVLNGGTMWQHVNGHAGVGTHELLDLETGEVVQVTSTHHQMMQPAESAKVIGVAFESQMRMSEGTKVAWRRTSADEEDYEVLWYPKTKSLCFQPHPEFRPGECRDYFFNILERVSK